MKGEAVIFGNMKNPITGNKFKKDAEMIAKKEKKSILQDSRSTESPILAEVESNNTVEIIFTDEIELIKPIGPPKKINIEKFIVIKTGEELEVVNTNAIVKVYLEDKVEEMDMFRIKL